MSGKPEPESQPQHLPSVWLSKLSEDPCAFFHEEITTYLIELTARRSGNKRHTVWIPLTSAVIIITSKGLGSKKYPDSVLRFCTNTWKLCLCDTKTTIKSWKKSHPFSCLVDEAHIAFLSFLPYQYFTFLTSFWGYYKYLSDTCKMFTDPFFSNRYEYSKM